MSQLSWIPMKPNKDAANTGRKAPERRCIRATAALLRAAGALPKPSASTRKRLAEEKAVDNETFFDAQSDHEVEPAAPTFPAPVSPLTTELEEEPAVAPTTENVEEGPAAVAVSAFPAPVEPASPVKEEEPAAELTPEPVKEEEPAAEVTPEPVQEEEEEEEPLVFTNIAVEDKPVEAKNLLEETEEEQPLVFTNIAEPAEVAEPAVEDKVSAVPLATEPCDEEKPASPLVVELDDLEIEVPAQEQPEEEEEEEPLVFTNIAAVPPPPTEEFLSFCLGGANAVLEAALDGDLDLAAAALPMCSADDDDGADFAVVDGVVAMAMGDCESESVSACSGDDLEDMFDFNPDTLAQLMNKGAGAAEVTEHLEGVFADAFERRMAGEKEEDEEQVPENRLDPDELGASGEVEQEGAELRPEMGALESLMTPTLTPNMTPLTSPKNRSGTMVGAVDTVAEEEDGGKAKEMDEEAIAAAQERRRKSEALRKRPSLARRESAGLEAVAAAGRASLARIQEFAATSAELEGVEIAEEELAEVESAIDKATRAAGLRHRRSIAKAAEVLEAAAEAIGEDVDDWAEEKVDEKIGIIHEAMEEARKRHRRSIATAVQEVTDKPAATLAAAAAPFVPAAVAAAAEPSSGANNVQLKISQAVQMAFVRKRAEQLSDQERVAQAMQMARNRKRVEVAEGDVAGKIHEAVQMAQSRKHAGQTADLDRIQEAMRTAQARKTAEQVDEMTAQQRIQQAMQAAQERRGGEASLYAQGSPQSSPQKQGSSWEQPWEQSNSCQQWQQEEQQAGTWYGGDASQMGQAAWNGQQDSSQMGQAAWGGQQDSSYASQMGWNGAAGQAEQWGGQECWGQQGNGSWSQGAGYEQDACWGQAGYQGQDCSGMQWSQDASSCQAWGKADAGAWSAGAGEWGTQRPANVWRYGSA